MNLIIDQGNSVCKWAFFENVPKAKTDYTRLDALEPAAVFHTRHPEEMLSREIFKQFKPRAAIYSSVLNHTDDVKYEAIKQNVSLCFRIEPFYRFDIIVKEIFFMSIVGQ
jgi:pantothenate kinase type III